MPYGFNDDKSKFDINNRLNDYVQKSDIHIYGNTNDEHVTISPNSFGYIVVPLRPEQNKNNVLGVQRIFTPSQIDIVISGFFLSSNNIDGTDAFFTIKVYNPNSSSSIFFGASDIHVWYSYLD